jgi:hypothetical protein
MISILLVTVLFLGTISCASYNNYPLTDLELPVDGGPVNAIGDLWVLQDHNPDLEEISTEKRSGFQPWTGKKRTPQDQEPQYQPWLGRQKKSYGIENTDPETPENYMWSRMKKNNGMMWSRLKKNNGMMWGRLKKNNGMMWGRMKKENAGHMMWSRLKKSETDLTGLEGEPVNTNYQWGRMRRTVPVQYQWGRL